MESIIEDTVSDEELQKAEIAFNDVPIEDTSKYLQAKFEYAYALLKSNPTNVRKGIQMLENLYSQDQASRRDYLHYMAIGHTRLKQYKVALDLVDLFLEYEPHNRQSLELRKYINSKLTKDAMFGMAVAGGTVLAVGGLLGLLLSKR